MSMKCKTFFGNTLQEVEEDVNEFLDSNQNITIRFISNSQSDSMRNIFTNYSVVIFYEDFEFDGRAK